MASTIFPSPVRRRAGFTLLELLIVIGIIGILAAVAMGAFGGASESAKAAKCMNNMRNLAVACHSAAAASDGSLPAAGSYEYYNMMSVVERRGWISWLNMNNAYSGGKKTQHVASPSWTPYCTYQEGNKSEYEKARFSLTNGVLWHYVGRTAETYVCPNHVKACKEKHLIPVWSYVMNSLFGYDTSKGSDTIDGYWQSLTRISSLTGSGVHLSPEKVLMFAELPFTVNPIVDSVELEGTSSEYDCTLQYNSGSWSSPEAIGFNHKVGKRFLAHVAFADGHVAKMMMPSGASRSDILELTTWLCQGDEISFTGKVYKRITKGDNKTKH